MAEAIRFFELNTGAKIPSVGLGTWRAEPGVIDHAITTSIKVINVPFSLKLYEVRAQWCWMSLTLLLCKRRLGIGILIVLKCMIGFALKKLFDDGIVKREDLWITSKLWCTDHAPEDVPKALDKSLQDLQLEYLDLYLVHWPVSMKKDSVGYKPEYLTQPDLPGTWKAMEALYDSGKARTIGVSNFSTKKLGDLLEVARVPPAVNQVECHPQWQQPKLHAFCKSKGVHLTGYSPLGKSKVVKNPILTYIAEKLCKSPAQVALRWGLQMGHSVVPKSTNEDRIKENYDVFDWSIPEDLFAKFSDIEQERLITGAGFVHETFSVYKTLEELWDGEL